MRKIDSQTVHDLENQIILRVSSLKEQNTAAIRGVRREFSRAVAQASPEVIIKVALRLIRRSELIYRFFAYELVQHHPDARRSLNARSLEELGRGIDSWAAVDTFASYLAGPALREGQISDSLIRRWARSKDRWWRRAALVSTVPLNTKARGGKGDSERTLKICEMFVEDRDEMVVKALSWALRELAKRDPPAVRQFLSRHERNLASRVVREVKSKLSTGLKNPRRRKVNVQAV